jgi:hypothetical protein
VQALFRIITDLAQKGENVTWKSTFIRRLFCWIFGGYF